PQYRHHPALPSFPTRRSSDLGSNMDLNELQAGSTLYLPVFLKGGLIWTGDSHCRQGNGEVNLTALECAYKEIEIQPIVHKQVKTDRKSTRLNSSHVSISYAVF